MPIMPIRRLTPLALVAAAALLVSPAVADDAPQPIEPEAVSLGRPVDFEQDVAPVLAANCLACHSKSTTEGELSLETIETMLKGGDRGPAVVPAKPDESLLLAVAAHRREPVMPPPDNDVKAKPLTPRELGLLRQWIAEGASKGSGSSARMIAWRPLPAGYKAIHGVALSGQARFAAAARGNQLEVYDLPLGVQVARLTDPNLAALAEGGSPLYPDGAADRDLIEAVAFSPDETLLASGGYRAVKLWRRAGLGDAQPLDLAGVTAFAVSADRALLAAAAGNEVRLVNLADGKTTSTWPTPAKATALAFSPDGQSVAAACDDASLQQWKLSDGQPAPPRKLPSPAKALAFAGERAVTAHDDGALRVWPAAGDMPERELKGHSGPVTALAPVPGQPNAIASAGEDGTVRLWDVTNGAQQRSIGHGNPVAAIALSPDGKTLASAGRDGSVRLWNAGDGNKLGEHLGLIPRRRAETQAAAQLEWRKQLVSVTEAHVKEAEAAVKEREESAKKSVEMKAAAEKTLAEAKQADEQAAAAAKTAAEAAAAKADDAALKKASEEAAKKAEEAKKKATDAEEALKSAERGITLSDEAVKHAGQRLEARKREKQSADEAAKAAEDASTAAKAEAAQPVAASALAFAPDGRRVAAGFADGTVQTFSAAAQPLDSIATGPAVADLAFTADGRALVRAADGTIRRADVTGRWEYAAVLGPPQDTPADLARSAFADRVLAVAFSPDGRLLATGGGEPSRGGELILWDVASRAVARAIPEAHSDTVQSVSFSRDGKLLATAGADKFARVFEAETGKLVRTLEGHTDHVLAAAAKADGTAFATASADASVKVWDGESGEQKKTITGHTKQVTALRFVGLTEDVATASGDHTVRLYRTSNASQVRGFAGPTDYVHSLDVSGDGSTLAAAGEDGALYVWDVKDAKLRHKFDPPQPTTTAAK